MMRSCETPVKDAIMLALVAKMLFFASALCTPPLYR
jgi:hypothetical protein